MGKVESKIRTSMDVVFFNIMKTKWGCNEIIILKKNVLSFPCIEGYAGERILSSNSSPFVFGFGEFFVG